MTQFEGGARRTAKPTSNVYTVLVFIAFVPLAAAIGVVAWRNIQLNEDIPAAGSNPFYVVQEDDLQSP